MIKLTQWPALKALLAGQVVPEDLIYGKRLTGEWILFDESWTVTAVLPGAAMFTVRIEGHESDLVPGFMLFNSDQYVLIKKWR
jgi:hypothetical protein